MRGNACLWLISLAFMVATIPAQTAAAKQTAPDDSAVIWLDELDASSARELEWEALIPQDWRADTLFDEIDIEALDDADPRAQELLEKMRKAWDEAPVVTSLAGQRVRLPGFVVPLEMDATQIQQFLLVPYFGACIHVPPPPANQIIHVVVRDDTAFDGRLFDTVWVTGTMNVERLSHELGDAGYRLDDAIVMPYEIEDP